MKSSTIGAFQAKTHLSELIEQVRQGRTFVITHRGRPVAELRPVAAPERRMRFGCDRDRVVIGPDFDKPIPGFAEYIQ